jgi:hypothetical protein
MQDVLRKQMEKEEEGQMENPCGALFKNEISKKIYIVR